MANWQTKLQLCDVYHAGKPIPELAAIVADRLSQLKLPAMLDEYDADRRDELVMDFRDLANDPSSGVDDFDSVMEELYNWADISLDGQWGGKKLCWVETHSKASA